MLFQYREQTQRLLRDTSIARYTPGDLDYYINRARGQIAGESECLPIYATLSVDDTSQQYPFSAVTFPIPESSGIGGILNIRKISWLVMPPTPGQVRMTGREWEWFQNYVLNDVAPTPGQPKYWSQFGQGARGTLFINLLDSPYTLNLDTVCFPADLADDSSPELLPYQWTDAVPFYAAYLGLLFAQNLEAATSMLKLFDLYMTRARGAALPSVLPHQFRGGPDPVLAGRLGLPHARERSS